MSLRRAFANTIRNYPLLMRIPYTVYRFFQPKYSVGVIGVVINTQREVLLVEHVFHPKMPWGLPGGWIGFNEDPAQAVEREILEELGIIVQTSQHLLTRRTDYNHLDVAFWCQADNVAIQDISYELLRYRWYDETSLPHLKSFQYHAIMQAFREFDKEKHSS